jgi:hypothetical protein
MAIRNSFLFFAFFYLIFFLFQNTWNTNKKAPPSSGLPSTTSPEDDGD